MSAVKPQEEKLKRAIGPFGYSAIALNGVIGAGIFALPAYAIEQGGGFSPWLFVICAVLILTIVLAFARAASYVSSTGGPIVYATKAFGGFVGFQAGWLLYLSRLAALAANIVLMVTYIGWFWPEATAEPYRWILIVGITAFFTALNVVGVRSGMAVMWVLTALKLLPLALLIVFGLPELNGSLLFDSDVPELSTMGETVLTLLYAFVGFESAVIPAGEGRNPRRDLPLALVLTVSGIALFYFLIQWISVSVAPDLAGNERPLATVAAVLMGGLGASLLSTGAVFSIGGNSSASVLSAPRLPYALALDGRMPRWFGVVSERYRTPANSVVFYGVAAMALGVSGSFIFLAKISTLVRLLMYVICIASLPRLHRIYGERPGQFRLPGGYLIPLLALVLCGWLFLHASAEAWLWVVGFIAAGAAFYVVSRRQTATE